MTCAPNAPQKLLYDHRNCSHRMSTEIKLILTCVTHCLVSEVYVVLQRPTVEQKQSEIHRVIQRWDMYHRIARTEQKATANSKTNYSMALVWKSCSMFVFALTLFFTDICPSFFLDDMFCGFFVKKKNIIPGFEKLMCTVARMSFNICT